MDLRPVHIVDDDADYLVSLTQLVNNLGFQTVCYASGNELLEQPDDRLHGCLILDLKMPQITGFTVLEELAKRRVAPPVIVLTGYADVPAVVRAYQSGLVVAFLQKQAVSEIAILEAIQAAMARDDEQRSTFTRRNELEVRLSQLTQPEVEVLNLLMKGADHTRIAEALDISRRTVENRRAKIMKKIGANSFPELVRLVLDAGYRPEA
ncbi:MAG: response regulator [Pirellulales bacterium]